jgi:hypothetical protein
VFDGEISKYAMSVPTAKFGSLASQNSLATSVARFETYVNSDFFDFGTYMPYSAIVSKSNLVYSPPLVEDVSLTMVRLAFSPMPPRR